MSEHFTGFWPPAHVYISIRSVVGCTCFAAVQWADVLGKRWKGTHTSTGGTRDLSWYGVIGGWRQRKPVDIAYKAYQLRYQIK